MKNRAKLPVITCISAIALWSCGEESGGNDSNSKVNNAASLTISGFNDIPSGYVDYILSNANEKNVAVVNTEITDQSFVARAKYSDDGIGNAPTGGSVKMVTEYNISGYQNIQEIGNNRYTYSPIKHKGEITLTFNFHSTQGAFSGSNPDINFSGNIIGNDISGTVNFMGLKAELDGAVDAFSTIGAFHANGDDLTYAGIFLG